MPELDGLRAIAVLLVMWQHVPQGVLPRKIDVWGLSLVQPGYLGVDIFFVLSGFLITRILLVDSRAGLPLKNFLIRRFLRIFPIYYLTLAVIAIVRWGPELPWCAAYLANYYFAYTNTGGPLTHTWSLSVEEHFYLVWPLLVYGLPRLAGRLVPWLVFLPIALLSALHLTLQIPAPAEDPEAFVAEVSSARSLMQQATHFRIASLALGAVLAYGEGWFRSRPARALPLGGLLFGAGYGQFLTGFLIVGDVALPAWKPGFLPWVPAAFFVAFALVSCSLVLAAVGLSGSRFPPVALLRTRALAFVGRISYGLYLYHLPVYFALGLLHGRFAEPPSAGRVLLAVALSFAVATLSYFVIERPILRYAARFRSRKPA